MPMDIEGALWAYAHKDEYPDMGRRAEAAIREAFAIAATVRNPGDAIRAFVDQHPRRADLPWYVRGLARQFCEFVLERAGVEVPREKAQDRARRTTTEDREEGSA